MQEGGGDYSYGYCYDYDKSTVGRPQQGGFFGAIGRFNGQQEGGLGQPPGFLGLVLPPGQDQEGADRPKLGPNPNFNEQHLGHAGGQLQPPTAAADDDSTYRI